MKDKAIPRLLTLPAASRALNISQRQLRAAIDRGDLEAVKFRAQGWPRVSEDAIRHWLAKHRMSR